MKRISQFLIIITLLCSSIPSFALDAPTLTVSTSGLDVSSSWIPVSGATSYKLHYAPYPYTGPETIDSADMGNDTSFSANLPDGASYYVAITASNGDEESDYSNIELFTITDDQNSCDSDYAPVCGTDDQTYSNACNAEVAGVEIQYQGTCAQCDNNNPGLCTSGSTCSNADGYWDVDSNTCATSIDSSVSPISTGTWYHPPVLASWQWQLKGSVDTTYQVDIYDIDLFDTSETSIQQLQLSGKKVICYFSAGSHEEWRADANQFTESDLGNTLDGWDGERWLDVRSANVHSIMRSRLDLAVQKNCDGVEPDNMDGYINNSGFSLTASDQLGFNRFIANEAHLRGLSVGLKNDLDQIIDLVDYYDFAVNEQCFEFSECDTLSPFINSGKAVLNAEYKQEYVDNETKKDGVCNESLNMQFSTLILPLDLDDKFRISCLSQ